jgi:hypothetical protein
MARTINSNDVLVAEIIAAREAEKEAVRQARIKYDGVLASVRKAVFDGMSTRQIGFAYGSSDPHTAKRIVEEAMAGFDIDQGDAKTKAGWLISLPDKDNSLFTITAYGLGDNKADGAVVVSMDEDEVNITAQDGDFWVVSQLYRQGLVANVINDYWKARRKRDGI